MPAERSSRYDNCIFAALSRQETAQLHASSTPFELNYGDVLFESGDRLRHVYFPTAV
jgi:hypothetical protein